MTSGDWVLDPPMVALAATPEHVAQVRAALSEGFCPDGHPLERGDRGLCAACGVLWRAYPGGVTYRVLAGWPPVQYALFAAP